MRCVRSFVGKRYKVGPCVEDVVECTNTFAMMKEGALKGERESVRQMDEWYGLSPGLKRGMGAFERVPASIEIACKDAGTLGGGKVA
jgi:hypothetical protein